MRKLVALVIAGAALVAIVIYFARPPGENATRIRASGAPAAAASERHEPQVSNHELTADAIDTHAQLAVTARESSSRVAVPIPAEQQQQQQQAACLALSESRTAREQATLNAEPKDPAWAYPMEQKLREYLTQKLHSGQVEVIGIDCKTTFCAIKALLLDPEGSMEFTSAISEIAGKSWNDFIGTGTSLSQESGKTFYIGRLTREQFKEPQVQTAEEARAEAACWAPVNEKQKRERAARDAQPKDLSWAEPMEQLLRQYLTTQLAKHPPERLEVDCKTTFCRIAAQGRTSDSYEAFQKFAQAAATEPWANLRNGEGGGSSSGDNWKQEYFVYRR